MWQFSHSTTHLATAIIINNVKESLHILIKARIIPYCNKAHIIQTVVSWQFNNVSLHQVLISFRVLTNERLLKYRANNIRIV